LDELVAILTAFKQRHGHCLVTAREGADQDLLDWLKDVRKSKKQGRLDPRYVRQLERLGFVWRPTEQYRQEMYSALLDYRKRYGNCRVPWQWRKNPRLAYWVGRMRAAKRRNKLTEAQIQQLDKIGFAWDFELPQEWKRIWEQRVKELKAFKRRHGHCNVPCNYPLNPALGHWVSSLRYKKKHGKLTEERVRLLDGLGFSWVRNVRSLKKRGKLDEETTRRLDWLGFCWVMQQRSVRRYDWDKMVAALTAFKKRHGHCNVPAGGRENSALGVWLTGVRRTKRCGQLDPQRIRQLEKLGVVWEPKKQLWEEMYAALAQYRKEYGECNVPHKWPKNRALARWVRTMRLLKRRNQLTEARIRQLDKLGFVWDRSKQQRWETMCAALADYRRLYGHCRVSTVSKTHRTLGNWVRNQRGKRKRGKLSAEQIRRLDQLGFAWELQQVGKGG
jgi:hypothetical protein